MRTMRSMSACLMIALMICANENGLSYAQDEKTELKGTITMSGAWALYPMAVKWAEEFRKIHPDVQIDIAAGGAGKGMADALASIADIGNVSRDIYPEEIEKGAWFVAVTKDAVVPTCNADNPFRSSIMAHGITREALAAIWTESDAQDWKRIVPDPADVVGNTELHVYSRSDACGAAEMWAKYFGKKQEDLLGVGVYGDPGLAEAVRNDIFGIGFNNINYAYDAKSKEPIRGIAIIPIDLNGDGTLQVEENFYTNRDAIAAAIAAGTYPAPPARDLYFVSNGKPQKPVVRAFIQWVLTEGQQYVSEAGYINVTDEKIKEGLEKLAA